MKEIGKTDSLMGLEYSPFQMGVDTKDSGLRVNIMEEEFIKLQTEQSMMETGNLENIMAWELFNGQTEVYTEESGKTVERMEEENSTG